MKCIQSNLSVLLVSAVLLISCSQESSESQASLSQVPQDIKKLDNLAVYSPDTPPAMNIELERETRFGNTDEVIIGLVRHVAIDDRGRVYLGDSGWGHRGVYVFESDGTFIKRMAGEGKGPGEVLSINNMGIVNNELYLYDGQQKRINFYSLESLSVDRTQILDTDNWSHVDSLRGSYPSGYLIRNNSLIVVTFFSGIDFDNPDYIPHSYYYLANETGKIISDEILRLPTREYLSGTIRGASSAFTLEHVRQSLLAHTPNNNIITAWTEEFLLKKYGPNGEYKSAIYYPYERQPIDEDKVLNKYDEAWKNNPDGIDRYKKQIRSAELPERWPALKSMLVDDEGRIWVATIGSDEQNFDWWVLGKSGELIGRFKFPRGNEVIKIKKGKLFARLWEDGVETFIRYNISMKPYDGSQQRAAE